jgi:inosine/guanosine/xanthosine phosphorylase family protein
MDMTALETATRDVAARLQPCRPAGVLILGSGWGAMAERMQVRVTLPYEAIPLLGGAGVAGHAGRLHMARIGQVEWLVFQGRRHAYEGVGWESIAFPIHLAKSLGGSIAILTNAAGSLKPDLPPGSLMVVGDHINSMGVNPLVGPHDPFWGPRFPDQGAVYDAELRERLAAVARAAGVPLRPGIYLGTLGPTYETPAEVAAFRSLGADAVGMSAVPEAILAYAAGLRVLALSCMTNLAAGIGHGPISHEEALAVSRRAAPDMERLLLRFLGDLPPPAP